ncbi:hypothetical protein ACWGM0_17790 [Sphingomonas bisphenolicum]
MKDLSGYRPFSLTPFRAALIGGGIYQGAQLIIACQMKHLGFVDARTNSKGAEALAAWLIAKADYLERPKPTNHPLNSGTVIERLLAGDILPDEDFAVALAEATEGAVLPNMFGLPARTAEESPASGVSPLYPDVGEKAPEPVRRPHVMAPAPSSTDLPPLGALGGALPPGRLFHPIADARFDEGFVLTGCGVMLCLDESTALAMRDALNVGIAHLRDRRASARSIAA